MPRIHHDFRLLLEKCLARTDVDGLNPDEWDKTVVELKRALKYARQQARLLRIHKGIDV